MIDLLITRLRNEARRIWCYRWLAAVTTLVVWCGAAAYVRQLPSTYDAWGQIYVEQQTPLVSATEGVSLVGKGYGGPYVALTTMLNDNNLESIVRRIDPAAASMNKAELATAVARLRAKITRAPDPGDGFLELHVTDTDPVRARDIVHLLMQQFISTNIGRSQRDLQRAGAFLDQQIAAYGSRLADSQENMAAFRRSHPAVAALSLPAGRNGMAQPGAFGWPAPANEPPEISAGPEAATDASATAPRTPSPAEQRVADLESKLASLRTTYTERYPDVVAIRRQLADAIAARDLERSVETATDALRPRTPERRTGAPRTVSRGPALPPPLPPEVATRWADLQRTDEMLRANYQQLLMKRDATRMSLEVYSGDEAGKYQIVRPPTVPTMPKGPPRLLYLGGATLLSVAAGLAVGYARAASRGILVSRQELEDIYQLPVIGAVSWEPAWRTGRTRQAWLGRGASALPGRLRSRFSR